MRKYILRCKLSLGDIVLFTAAVRDLHLHFPGRYATDVRTCFPDLWKHNPYLTSLGEYDLGVRVVDCGFPLINASHTSACHSIHGFIDFLNQYLGTHMKPTAFRGDIHLSRREKSGASEVRELAGGDIPFWLISAGGKYDCTIKWWDARRYQEVVDHFRSRIQFVQVGDLAHYHPSLAGVIDVRGRTSVRDLVRLVYHAQGVLCGVTGLMHLAAAVPVPHGRGSTRPCVVVAGGRESPHWEAYPGHQFIHTVGMLPCCRAGGCWKSRTVPLGDGDERDRREQLCVDVHNRLPRCMDMISSGDVIRRIESYFSGGARQYLSTGQAKAATKAVKVAKRRPMPAKPLNFHTAPELADQFINVLPPYHGNFEGRGIVICGGGVRMFTNAWVGINMLRQWGCSLPIELWHFGDRELDAKMEALVAPLDVRCIDVVKAQRNHSARLAHVWALKPYAILYSRFKEVLLLDADNVPVANPEFLFDTPQFRRVGAVFWPDYWRLRRESTSWKLFGVPYRDGLEFETGQILVDKEVCWRALSLALWYNEHSDLYYQHVYGDKETFHMAFRKLNLPYARPRRGAHRLAGAMCQHDFHGRRLFQHRTLAKWDLSGPNRRIRDFWFDKDCRRFLNQLQVSWDGQIEKLRPRPLPPSDGEIGHRPAGSEIRLFVCMASCREQGSVRQMTLDNFSKTDGAGCPLRVQLDERRFSNTEDNLTHAAWCALQAGLRTDAEYFLYLADDLEFNRHFLHNLRAWPLFKRRAIALASLYNPGVRELTRIPSESAIAIEPCARFKAQALIISRAAGQFFLKHWFEGPERLDAKLRILSAGLDTPVFCHSPSLVQHLKNPGSAKGTFHQAVDFRRDWKSPSLDLAELQPVAAPAEATSHG